MFMNLGEMHTVGDRVVEPKKDIESNGTSAGNWMNNRKKGKASHIASVIVYFASLFSEQCKPIENLDVAFLIDNSASIPAKDFEAVKVFSDNLIDAMAKGGTVLKVGLIEFSDKAVSSIWLDDQANKKSVDEIRKKFKAIEQPTKNYNTNTHIALFIARTQMLNMTYEEGARCTCSKIIILVTDGSPSWGTYTYNEAAAARQQGIHIFVVGTGADANFPSGTMGSRKMLALYFTGGDKSKVFRVTEYSKLKDIIGSINEGTCKGKTDWSVGFQLIVALFLPTIPTTAWPRTIKETYFKIDNNVCLLGQLRWSQIAARVAVTEYTCNLTSSQIKDGFLIQA
jgi:hypothetical protein